MITEAANRIVSRHRRVWRGPVVERPELFERLDAGLRGRLTLVTAAPGSGKTVLLETWLQARPALGPAAWMSLDLSDGNLARFWSNLLEVLRDVSQGSLDRLPDPTERNFEAALGAACDALPAPVVAVLDDFEQLHSWKVIESLDRFLRSPQTHVRLIIASRRDPGLSLQRLRLAGQLTELRSSDLAFTLQETREVFDTAGITLSDDQVHKLHGRTEGWAGGIRLAALSLRGRPDPDAFVRAFDGDERTVADYLVEEVLHQQPTAIREFMLRTSVVDELEPDLANTLTGRDDGAQTLELLERSNAFLMPLDDHRQRYRYHAMFRELLRSQLKYRMPDAFALEHRRAARWYAARGRSATAVHNAMAAGDLAMATGLLSDRWLTLIVQGHGAQLRDWIDGLAQPVVAASAELALAGAGAALAAGDQERARGYAALADAGARDVPGKRRARYVLFRAIVTMLDARVRGDYETTRNAARRVLATHQLADFPGHVLAVAHENLGVAECWSPDADGGAESWAPVAHGVEHLEQALALARSDSSEFVVLDCLSQLALFKALGGALGEAVALGQSAVSLALRQGCDEHAAVAPAFLALAIAHLIRADLEGGVERLQRALSAARASQVRATRCLIELSRARVVARADVGEAIRIASTAGRNAESWKLPPVLVSSACFLEAVFAAQAGAHDHARAALSRGKVARRAPVEFAVVSARLALAVGRPIDGLRHLQSERARNARAMHPATRIEAIALAAVCKHQLHDDAGALALVEQALELAQPEGYRSPLLTVGPSLRDLLRRRIRAGTAHRALAGELIERLDHDGRFPDIEAPALLLDPLSDREEAVLRYLPTAMSKAEIASELFVSVNTVKTHTKNIYRKLGVRTRTEAVRRAKSLNLV